MTIPEHMAPYPKINTLYKRDEKGKIILGEYARPEFELLYHTAWLWTEKVDGTNIRLGYDPEGFRGNEHFFIAGRTNNAQIPKPLFDKLMEIQRDTPYEDHFDGPVTLYGEGYGAGIQKGGVYLPDSVDFVLFDVKIGKWWLDYDDVVDIGLKLGVEVVPKWGVCGIEQAEDCVAHRELPSGWGDHFVPEGLVGRPTTTLYNKAGERILCKIKDVDYWERAECAVLDSGDRDVYTSNMNTTRTKRLCTWEEVPTGVNGLVTQTEAKRWWALAFDHQGYQYYYQGPDTDLRDRWSDDILSAYVGDHQTMLDIQANTQTVLVEHSDNEVYVKNCIDWTIVPKPKEKN